jgi:hypothetical protein
MKRYVLLPICVVLFLGGCSNAELQSAILQAQQTQSQIRQELNATRSMLEETGEQEDLEKLSVLESHLDRATDVLDGLEAAVEASRTSLGDGIQAGAGAVAPLLGPYGPVLVGVAGLISTLLGRKSGIKAGVKSVAGPIEAARDRQIETKLNKNPGFGIEGQEFLVVRKDAVKVGHINSGAAKIFAG